MNDTVYILLAAYNGETYLKAQLESIRQQTYKKWHLIIRDDHSSDDTLTAARRFQADMPEGQVDVFENEMPTGSAGANFLRLIEDAKNAGAAYVMFCDQDDVWLPKKIEYTLKAMKRQETKAGNEKTAGNEKAAENEKARKAGENGTGGKNVKIAARPVLVHSDLCVVDEKRHVIAASMQRYQKLPTDSSVRQLLIQNNVTGCTVMINAPLLELLWRAARSGEAQYIVMHDYWAALTAAVFGDIVYIRRPLIEYRQHGGNSVGAMNASGFRYMYERYKAGRAQFCERITDTMRQAGAFVTVYEAELEKNPYKALIKAYAKLPDASKTDKIRFYLSNHVMKYGIIRKIMQFIWS